MDVTRNVAKNFKLLRERKRLSLDNVAALTGVSKSMLGQIERGEVNPTITVMSKIANGLKISFSALLERGDEPSETVRGADVDPLYEDDGRYVNYPIFTFSDSRPFEIFRIVVKPHGHLESQDHLPGSEEYVTVFSGAVVITSGGIEHPLAAGDSLRFAADVHHAYRNDTDEPAELSMMIYYGK